MTLREARMRKRLTQIEVGYQVNLSQPEISMIERGYLKPSPGILERIGAVLGIPGDQLEVPEEPVSRWAY